MQQSEVVTLTESEVARRLNVSVSGLRKWRREKQGPRFVRIGRRLIRYRERDLWIWLEENAAVERAASK